MKRLITLGLVILLMTGIGASAQSIVGTWQLTDQKTCFQSQFEESATEKELASGLGASSKTAVAKIIRFGEKGTGEDGIFSQGRKKGSGMTSFRYQVANGELQFLDKKSGMITSRYVVDELGETTLVFHDVKRDCEIKTFTRVK